jgi:hypothetical protein
VTIMYPTPMAAQWRTNACFITPSMPLTDTEDSPRCFLRLLFLALGQTISGFRWAIVSVSRLFVAHLQAHDVAFDTAPSACLQAVRFLSALSKKVPRSFTGIEILW